MSAATLTIIQTDATQGIAVPYTAVRGFTVSSLGGGEPAAQMEFLDETHSTIIPVTSAADGSFLLRPLLAGDYTPTAPDGDLPSVPPRIRAPHADPSLNGT